MYLNMEGKVRKREWNFCVRKDDSKISGQKRGGGDETTMIGFAPNSKFTQYNFHYTCNLVLHNALWVTPPSFFFLFNGVKRPLHHDRGKE